MDLTSVPSFAVVGHTNEGKSSVVATLCADESVRIDSAPRTTREVRAFPVTVDGEPVLELLDTPGFENARRMLHLLSQQEVPADQRPEAVRRFLASVAGDPAFEQERRLLTPILEGAGVLYVVDGSHPFRRRYLAEMEILRWTGRPRMALINDKDRGQHVDSWRSALDQYFRLVRYFNAHQSTFANRIALLRALRELDEGWQASLDRAIEALLADRRRRRRQAARVLATMLAELLTHVTHVPVGPEEDVQTSAARIEGQFHDELRRGEQRARRKIEALYDHRHLRREEDDLSRPVLQQDLFAEETWNVLGLSHRQLLVTGAVGGAAVGGTLDAAVGGASFLLGTVLGTVAGAGSAWMLAQRRFASAGNLLRSMRGDRVLRVGPHGNPQFPWILLDRALLHYRLVAQRAHADRSVLRVDPAREEVSLVTHFDAATRRRFEKIFRRLQKGRSDEGLVGELVEVLDEVLAALDDGDR